jgi:hypothetical protein
MAQDLLTSINNYHARHQFCETWMNIPGEGREFFAEVLGRSWQPFSDWLAEGPVVLLDADCRMVSPIDLPEKGWDVAAVHRGKCSNSYGTQDFLSTVVIFNDEFPEHSRRFYAHWMLEMLRWELLPKDKPANSVTRNERFAEAGWQQSWYADQAALNRVLQAHKRTYSHGRVEVIWDRNEEYPVYRVLPLRREQYAASSVGSMGARIVHFKGKGKLREARP